MRMAAQASKQDPKVGRGKGPAANPEQYEDFPPRGPVTSLGSSSRWTRLHDLWQAPLLIFSVALFGAAAWLFIDPKPGLSIDQKIDVARALLAQTRPEAAIEQLNRLLAKEKL